jgi:hypothetical protein
VPINNIDNKTLFQIVIAIKNESQIFAGCEVHGGGNEFDRSARGVEKAHLGRTNCDHRQHSKPRFTVLSMTVIVTQ